MRSCLIREHPNLSLSLFFANVFFSSLPFSSLLISSLFSFPLYGSILSVSVLNVLFLLMSTLPSRSILNIFTLPLFHGRYWVISNAHLSFKILLFGRAENEKAAEGTCVSATICTCKNSFQESPRVKRKRIYLGWRGGKKILKGETCTMICCMLAVMRNDSNSIDEP